MKLHLVYKAMIKESAREKREWERDKRGESEMERKQVRVGDTLTGQAASAAALNSTRNWTGKWPTEGASYSWPACQNGNIIKEIILLGVMFLWPGDPRPRMYNNETDTDRDTERKWAIKAIRAQNIFTHIYVDNLNNKKSAHTMGHPTQ